MLVRRPLEGLAFVAEIGGRPLSLTVPLRLGVAAALAVPGARAGVLDAAGGVAMVIACSAIFDVLLNAFSSGFRLRSAAYLMVSWLRAIVLLPRAFLSWMWTRRS